MRENEVMDSGRRCALADCGKLLPRVPPGVRGRRPIYCGSAHRNRAARERLDAARTAARLKAALQ